MAIRFRKRINLGPVKINFGKTGFTSVTIGGRWLSLSIGRGGTFVNGSLVGSGFGFRKRLDKPAKHKPIDNSELISPLEKATKAVKHDTRTSVNVPPLKSSMRDEDNAFTYPPAGHERNDV